MVTRRCFNAVQLTVPGWAWLDQVGVSACPDTRFDPFCPDIWHLRLAPALQNTRGSSHQYAGESSIWGQCHRVWVIRVACWNRL